MQSKELGDLGDQLGGAGEGWSGEGGYLFSKEECLLALPTCHTAAPKPNPGETLEGQVIGHRFPLWLLRLLSGQWLQQEAEGWIQ